MRDVDPKIGEVFFHCLLILIVLLRRFCCLHKVRLSVFYNIVFITLENYVNVLATAVVDLFYVFWKCLKLSTVAEVLVIIAFT